MMRLGDRSGQVVKEIHMHIDVKSVVIDWQAKNMEIKAQDGTTRTIPLAQSITVDMVGYPDREEKQLVAQDLGRYLSQGYMILGIDFEEGEGL
jgi:hypothetical protein